MKFYDKISARSVRTRDEDGEVLNGVAPREERRVVQRYFNTAGAKYVAEREGDQLVVYLVLPGGFDGGLVYSGLNISEATRRASSSNNFDGRSYRDSAIPRGQRQMIASRLDQSAGLKAINEANRRHYEHALSVRVV